MCEDNISSGLPGSAFRVSKEVEHSGRDSANGMNVSGGILNGPNCFVGHPAPGVAAFVVVVLYMYRLEGITTHWNKWGRMR